MTDETWEQAFFDPVDPDTDSDSIVKPSLKKQALLSNVFKATSNSVGSSLINCGKLHNYCFLLCDFTLGRVARIALASEFQW